ncbi:hypothetical protein BDZ91DRAFT_539642 [Kalaharituber pfeilii]|nr:hypothetical protein BDZ91DRAFT_539642 [Kalaharituber pfeilii]
MLFFFCIVAPHCTESADRLRSKQGVSQSLDTMELTPSFFFFFPVFCFLFFFFPFFLFLCFLLSLFGCIIPCLSFPTDHFMFIVGQGSGTK